MLYPVRKLRCGRHTFYVHHQDHSPAGVRVGAEELHQDGEDPARHKLSQGPALRRRGRDSGGAEQALPAGRVSPARLHRAHGDTARPSYGGHCRNKGRHGRQLHRHAFSRRRSQPYPRAGARLAHPVPDSRGRFRVAHVCRAEPEQRPSGGAGQLEQIRHAHPLRRAFAVSGLVRVRRRGALLGGQQSFLHRPAIPAEYGDRPEEIRGLCPS